MAVICSQCDQPMNKLPRWLSGSQVKFICDVCRQQLPYQTVTADIPEPVVTTEVSEDEPEVVPFSQLDKTALGEVDDEPEGDMDFSDDLSDEDDED
ncbi:MAG: hypothetical protein KIT45_07475 [Fimbriimonadia bacterium]|nr:hypothetical protein [Fimbriimonadia bacterium]